MTSVAPRLADRFDPLVNVYVPPLLQICARTNKVALKRAEKCLHLIAQHCQLLSLLPLLREACRDKVYTLRSSAVSSTVILIDSAGRDRLNRKVADIETIIKISATDSNPEVRQHSKQLFSQYVESWPERVESFTAPFSPTIRRYLALPKTGGLKVDHNHIAMPVQQPPKASRVARAEPVPERPFVAEELPKRVDRIDHDQLARRVERPSTSATVLPVETEEQKRLKLMRALAAAKAQPRPAAISVMSTGALKGLDTAAMFGPKRSDRTVIPSDRSGRHPERSRQPRDLLEVNLPSERPKTLSRSVSSSAAEAEAGPSRLITNHRMPSAMAMDARLASSASARYVSESHYAPASQGSEETYDLPALPRSQSSRAPSSSTDSEVVEDPRTTKTAPTTPALPSSEAAEEQGQQEMACQAVEDAEAVLQPFTPGSGPSEGIARRLAQMAKAQQDRHNQATERLQVEEGSEHYTPVMPSMTRTVSMPTRTPGLKASRVVLPVPQAPPPIQRQPSAMRVQRQNEASKDKSSKDLIAKCLTDVDAAEAPPKATTVRSKAPALAAASSKQTTVQSVRQPSSAAPLPAKKAAVPKTTAIKNSSAVAPSARGKVTSSITQSLTAKSKAVSSGAPSTSAPSSRPAVPKVAAAPVVAKKPTVQQARDLILSKKQAEVAKLKAVSKARTEQAQNEAKIKEEKLRQHASQMRAAEHHGQMQPASKPATTTSSRGYKHAEQVSHPPHSAAEEAAAAAWDELYAASVTRVVREETTPAENGVDLEASSATASAGAHTVDKDAPEPVLPSTRVSTSPLKAVPRPETPHQLRGLQSSPQRTPFMPVRTPSRMGNSRPASPTKGLMRESFTVFKDHDQATRVATASSPSKTPVRSDSASRAYFSSPADKSSSKRTPFQVVTQQLNRGAGVDFSPSEAGPLRLSPVKTRQATPVSLPRGTVFRPRAAMEDDQTLAVDSDKENHSPFPSVSKKSFLSKLRQAESHDSDAETNSANSSVAAVFLQEKQPRSNATSPIRMGDGKARLQMVCGRWQDDETDLSTDGGEAVF